MDFSLDFFTAQLNQLTEWSALLDVFLVTIIIFIGLKLIQGTRAMQMLRGFIIIAVIIYIALASVSVELPALTWLVQTISPVLFFAIPVIFQPELRRALEQLGNASGRYRHFFQRKQPNLALDSVVTASKRLSDRRHGALIVFEQETGLQEYVDTGVAISGEPSSDLLLTIFNKNTELHDGAVIIRNGKLAAAACVLPLSAANVSDRQIGLRHRAALGMSEVSDAVSLVISEETGRFAITHNGKLIKENRNDPQGREMPEQLKQLLEALLQQRKQKRPQRGQDTGITQTTVGGITERITSYLDFLRRFTAAFFSNLVTLMFSFVLAIIVWSAANQANDPISTRTLDLPIEIEGLLTADGEVDLNEDTVRITLQGPESVTNQLAARDFNAFIDQSALPFGQSDVEVQVRPVEEELNIKILAREPQTITVDAIQVVSVEVPVSVSIIGDVALGYEREEPVVDPEFILVTGPENEVNRLKEARINLFLESPREDYVVVRRPSWINRDDQSIALGSLETSASQVTISVEVNQTEGVKVIPVVASWTGTPPNGYRLLAINVEPQTALVSGSPTLLEQTQSIETETIDISGATESFEQRIPLNLPAGIVLDDVQPVVVSVEIEPIVTSDVIRKGVEIRALGEGLTVTVQTEEVTVFLFGPLPVLDSLTVDDVSVTLDLLDLPPGTHNIQPLVTVTAADVEFRSTQPEFVTVEIQPLEEVEGGSGGLTDESGSDPLARPDQDDTGGADSYP